MKKPKEAIERLRASLTSANFRPDDAAAILAHLDSIPDDAHVCEWPKGLTRERLGELAYAVGVVCSAGSFMLMEATQDALLALAVIAPKPKTRFVNFWRNRDGALIEESVDWDFTAPEHQPNTWKKINKHPVEIDG